MNQHNKSDQPSVIPGGFLGLFFVIILSQSLAALVPNPQSLPLIFKIAGLSLGAIVSYQANHRLRVVLHPKQKPQKSTLNFLKARMLIGLFTMAFFVRLILGF